MRGEALICCCKQGRCNSGEMQQFKHQVAQYIVLVDVFRSNLFKHAIINRHNPGGLFIRQLKDVISLRLKHLVLVQIAKLVEEMVVENAKCSFSNVVQMFPLVRNLGIGKRQGLFLYLHHFIRIVDFAIADHQNDFVKITPFVGDGFGVLTSKRFQP